MAKNECGKCRKIDNPYEVWVSFDGTWEWRVLKKYQSPENEAKNAYARWFCGVKSPFTHGSYDLNESQPIKTHLLQFLEQQPGIVITPFTEVQHGTDQFVTHMGPLQVGQ